MGRRQVSLIARTEVRRRVRAMDDPKQGLAYAISGLFAVMFGLFAIGGAFFAGRAVAGGDIGSPVSGVAAIAAFVLGLSVFMTGLRAVQHAAVPEHLDGLLVAVRHCDAVAGLLAVETLLPLGMIGVPGLLASVTFAVGAGSPATALLAGGAVVLLVLVGAVGGFCLGLLGRNAIARSRYLARYKSGIGILLMVVYFGVVFGSGANNVFAPVVRALTHTPLAWVGDLALLGVVPEASPVRAIGSVAVGGVTLVGSWLVTGRLAAWLWYSAPVEPTAAAGESTIGRLPGLPRGTDRIVRKAWTRARRAPIRLVYVAYPVVFAIGPVVTTFHGGVPAYAAPSLVVYGAWATGAAFTLNPIGDETPVLPVTLTTPISGRQFVGALWLAGGLVGVPLTLLLSGATAALAGVAPVDLVLLALLGTALPALAPGLASGIGAAFPRVEPASVTRSRQAVVPSLVAFGLYSLALLVLAAPAWLVLGGVRRTLAHLLGTTPLALGIVSTASAVLLVGVAALASFRRAARSFDEYTIA